MTTVAATMMIYHYNHAAATTTTFYYVVVVVVQGLEIYEIQNHVLWVIPSSPCPLLLKGSFAVFIFVLLPERTVFTVSCRW